MTWLASVLLKPLILFGYQVVVAGANWLIWKSLPDCKLKRALLKRY